MKILREICTKCSIFFILMLFAASVLSADAKKEISWMTDYEAATEVAKKESKPLFLYFSGSDWCSWCFKLDDEILKTTEFVDLVGPKFVFVKVDFPIYTTLDAKLTKQNEELKEKYHVHGFPTIILLDSKQNEIATLNYREGGGKAYADYVLKLLKEYDDFHQGVQDLNEQKTSALPELYERAQKLGLKEAAHSILCEGMNRNDSIEISLYFLKEDYRDLLQNGKIDDKQTKKIRAKLLAKDPDNQNHIHYDVAILDFEARSKNLPNEKTADKAVKPLQDYLARFGDKDTKHRWKMEMTISQVYRNKQQIEQALHYAKASHIHAPSYLKLDMAKEITVIEKEHNDIAEADGH